MELPVSGLSKEYKFTKIWLEMTLADMQDVAVLAAALCMVIGRKWIPADAEQQAISALKHADND